MGRNWEVLVALNSLAVLMFQGLSHLKAFRGKDNYYFIDEKTELQRCNFLNLMIGKESESEAKHDFKDLAFLHCSIQDRIFLIARM